ncbi:MAG: lipoprotein [Pseudomonadota bacterium]|nr:lipoprotein [Pseudomonadota bacterium]
MPPRGSAVTVTILAAIIALTSSACGQKGPLTLPVSPSAEQSKPQAKAGERPFPDVPATSEQK